MPVKYDEKTKLHVHNTLHDCCPIAKAKAPVDTNRLKKDIDKDFASASTVLNATGGKGDKEALNRYFKNVSESGKGGDELERAGEAILDRAHIRADSLDQARKGKIPAKAGKK